MKTILHVVQVAKPREDVFAALTTTAGLSGWWSTKVDGGAGAGGQIDFTFADGFNPDMQVTEAKGPALVGWKCVSGHEPWQDNTFGFELEETDTGTQLRFRQEYAQELGDDAYGTYNFNWGYYLESLRVYCEQGKGTPFQAA